MVLSGIQGLFIVFALLSFVRAEEVPADRFVYATVKRSGGEPYGDLWPDLRSFLEQTTSLQPWPQRRVLSWDDPLLKESPFLVLAGRGSVDMGEADLARLREYLSGGGFLLIDNTEADAGGPFARSVAALPSRLYRGASWKIVPPDHAVFRSFFLLRRASGRRRGEGALKGLWVGDRLAVIYAPDDLHGVWVRAPAGGWLVPCEPGGEEQRLEAQRLLANIVLYSLTGTYKTDAVHQEYILRKLESP
jgi:hypothetical protein